MTHVLELAEYEDCSLFYHETEQTDEGPWYRQMIVMTDDTEQCTRALRAVSGSDTAIHPRDWESRLV
jgi:hypothetical protein